MVDVAVLSGHGQVPAGFELLDDLELRGRSVEILEQVRVVKRQRPAGFLRLFPLGLAAMAFGWGVAHGHHRLGDVDSGLESLEGRVAVEVVAAFHLIEELQQVTDVFGLRENFRFGNVQVESIFQQVVVSGEVVLGLDEVVERRANVHVVAFHED